MDREHILNALNDNKVNSAIPLQIVCSHTKTRISPSQTKLSNLVQSLIPLSNFGAAEIITDSYVSFYNFFTTFQRHPFVRIGDRYLQYIFFLFPQLFEESRQEN